MVGDYKFQDEIGGDYRLETIINWIVANLYPQDVFPRSELEGWAEKNGYVKEAPDAQDENG